MWQQKDEQLKVISGSKASEGSPGYMRTCPTGELGRRVNGEGDGKEKEVQFCEKKTFDITF